MEKAWVVSFQSGMEVLVANAAACPFLEIELQDQWDPFQR